MTKPIFVTQPSLPELDDFIPYLEEIWKSRVLTNGGPFHHQLENALCDYLGVPYISLFSNGTIALATALKAIGAVGEVITTPYSFVATAHSVVWNGLTPVFVDIDPTTLNIDPDKIEEAITPRTSAILPVHVYGTPCDVEAIQAVADSHGLKVIYDAAHAFGVQCHCGSLLTHGDLSVLSFHATKVFNTLEGGAIISQDAETKEKVDQLKNFGFTSETTVEAIGINGKMNEVSAAFGLIQLKKIDDELYARKIVSEKYRLGLKDVLGITCLETQEFAKKNDGYFPIFVNDKYPISRDGLYEKLKSSGVNVRRYFYPLITEFPVYQQYKDQRHSLKNAETAASQILCLPIYPHLKKSEQDKIISLIKI